MSIEDYPADQPNPITLDESKGYSFGLTCWQVLQWFSYHIADMSLVTLNDVHPHIDGGEDGDERLVYEPSDQLATLCAAGVDTTPWTREEQLEFFHLHNDNLLKAWLLQVHPQADLTSLTRMTCRGRASNKNFPSNVVSMMHLPITDGDGASLPPGINENINPDYDLASMSVELQVVLFTCLRYNMIPTKMLLDIDLEFTFHFDSSSLSPQKELTVHVFLPLRGSFYSGFREYDPQQKLQVR